MPLRNILLITIILFLFACKKEEEILIIPAKPFATAGTNQNDVEKFQVTLNADSLKPGQSGKWTIEKGLIEDPLVYFSDYTNPNSKFNGMPGEIYSLKWTVSSSGGKISESFVSIKFKPLLAKIENLSPDNQTKFYLKGTENRRGLWTVDGKYAFIHNQTFGGTIIDDINAPYVEFQGYANTRYKLTWTTWYGSKSASASLEINTGNYLETEALDDLQLSVNSSRVVIENGHVTKLLLNASGIAWIFEDIISNPALQGLTYLKHLNMSGSSARAIAPVIGDKFRNLEYLNVDGTQIYSVPANIGNLKKLKEFVISHLNWGGILPRYLKVLVIWRI
ncbi:leucine-rich repeat domain-containing protein [Pedobacter sp. HDW13]|uniref:leucine-rich repeat domain-containing protein n=1 Tax=Pedobacter sp. HDW13 TaxID=2714940 RepID=UPI0014096627|nr:leucine-rich repeat domain-containing protein [Pedobacter sp. HDW13]QIL40694.1 leucine-rich repeat domain-containing protein [Pedobacter sp. HDW13]